MIIDLPGFILDNIALSKVKYDLDSCVFSEVRCFQCQMMTANNHGHIASSIDFKVALTDNNSLIASLIPL